MNRPQRERWSRHEFGRRTVDGNPVPLLLKVVGSFERYTRLTRGSHVLDREKLNE